MTEIITLTKQKYDELEKKLKYLETDKRSEISLAIKTAKEFGDLSENAEYSAAKDAQVANETEIARIEDILRRAEVIDETAITTDKVGLGTKVTVYDIAEDENVVYTVVSSVEASVRERKISDQSPIGKALIGHAKGDTVQADTPAGIMSFKILEISK